MTKVLYFLAAICVIGCVIAIAWHNYFSASVFFLAFLGWTYLARSRKG